MQNFFTQNYYSNWKSWFGLTESIDFTKKGDISYSSEPKQKIDVYIPNKQNYLNKKIPVIVYVHGGGWVRGS